MAQPFETRLQEGSEEINSIIAAYEAPEPLRKLLFELICLCFENENV